PEVDRLVDDVEEHGVRVVRWAAHQPVLGLRDLLETAPHVAGDRGRVRLRRPYGDPQPLPVDLERVEAVAADERFGVRQLVIVDRFVRSTPRSLERRRHLPAGRQCEPYLGGAVEPPRLVQEEIRPEELAEIWSEA